MTTEVQNDLSHAKREAAWLAFDAENPHVYRLFEKFAFEALRAGLRRVSAHAIFHKIRWEVAIETRSSDGFKLNDHGAPFAARRFMREHPEYGAVFETRDHKPRLSRRATG